MLKSRIPQPGVYLVQSGLRFVHFNCFYSFILSFSEFMFIFAAEIKNQSIMTAVQMQLNAELFGALQTISSDESLMKKAVRSLKRIAATKTSDENKMSLAELEDIVRQRRRRYQEWQFQDHDLRRNMEIAFLPKASHCHNPAPSTRFGLLL